MEDLSQEEAFWGALREPTFYDKFTSEYSSFISRLDRANDVSLDVQHVTILILIKDHTYRKK